jgi:hypothetical protein
MFVLPPCDAFHGDACPEVAFHVTHAFGLGHGLLEDAVVQGDASLILGAVHRQLASRLGLFLCCSKRKLLWKLWKMWTTREAVQVLRRLLRRVRPSVVPRLG